MNLIAIHNKTCATSRYAVFICLLLVIVTLLVYLQVGSHEFVTFDDGLYITENIRIQNRTNLENIAWSFTTTHSSNWHPLTWMSHMLDVTLFDMHPGSHHLMSLFFHLVNSLLLFFCVSANDRASMGKCFCGLTSRRQNRKSDPSL